MSIETSLCRESTNASAPKVPSKRRHPRVAVEAQVALVRTGIPERIIVHNKDLSWGGASVIVPLAALDANDSLVLRFPGHKAMKFSARAEVVWTRSIDDGHYLAGVSFSKLCVNDEKQLQSLLSVLARSGDKSEQNTIAKNCVEMYFLDREEMLAALEKIRSGSMETALFRSVQANERMPLVLTGYGDLPTLHLRARVLWQKAFSSKGNGAESGPFRVELALDHPGGDLKRAIDPLIAYLARLRLRPTSHG
jgi:hypothetical protein